MGIPLLSPQSRPYTRVLLLAWRRRARSALSIYGGRSFFTLIASDAFRPAAASLASAILLSIEIERAPLEESERAFLLCPRPSPSASPSGRAPSSPPSPCMLFGKRSPLAREKCSEVSQRKQERKNSAGQKRFEAEMRCVVAPLSRKNPSCETFRNEKISPRFFHLV